jgi:hypothetical protein
LFESKTLSEKKERKKKEEKEGNPKAFEEQLLSDFHLKILRPSTSTLG